MKNKKVRQELGQHEKDHSLEELQVTYKDLVIRAEEHGLNAGIFDGRIPVAKHVEREADEEEQVKKLLVTKGSFSASALWNVCGTRIGNASIVLRAQKEQLAIDAEKLRRNLIVPKARQTTHAGTTSTTKTRNCSCNNERQGLDRYHHMGPSRIECRWPLERPTEKDAIVAKLSSLDRDWKAYIPNIDSI